MFTVVEYLHPAEYGTSYIWWVQDDHGELWYPFESLDDAVNYVVYLLPDGCE